VLDGALRGWATPSETSLKSDEDYLSDDEVEDEEPSYRHPQEPQQQQSEYTATNKMLCELHALQQHRIGISSPSTLQRTSLSTNPSHLATTSTAIPSCLLRNPDKGLLPPPQELLRPTSSSAIMEKGLHDEGIATNETICTTGYKITNKCVVVFGQFFRSSLALHRFIGSLFLSRWLERHSPDNISNA
jgi:hypothetical protein